MALTVENHPQRKYIIDALLNGRPVRAIAATLDPALHYTSLQRYKKRHVRPAIAKAVAVAKLSGQVYTNTKTIKTNDVETVSEDVAGVVLDEATQALQTAPIVQPYLARIRQHQATIDGAIEDAKKDKDGRTVAALVTTDLKGIELDARLTGALDTTRPSGPDVNIALMVQIPRAVPAPEPRQLGPGDVEFSEPTDT